MTNLGRVMLVCAAVALAVTTATADEWNFNTNGDTEGWFADSFVTSADASGGDLVATADTYSGGGAPTVGVSGLSINADTHHYLYVDVERPFGSGTSTMGAASDYKDMKLYFDNGSGYSETDAKYLISHATNQGQHIAIFDLKTVPGGGGVWTGTVTGIRLGLITWDATDAMAGKTFRINRIAVTSSPDPYYWDFEEGGREGWNLSGGPTVAVAGGDLVLSGSPGPVYFTQMSWWSTGRMHFNADRDHYLRIDVSATSPVNDAKWLGFWIRDNGMSVNYETGLTVYPNTGTRSYFVDLATALPVAWTNANDLEGTVVLDTGNWAGFASDTISIDYIGFSDGSGDADGDCHSDAAELSDSTDPSDPNSNAGQPDVPGCGEDPPPPTGLPVGGFVGLSLLVTSIAAGGFVAATRRKSLD